MDQQLQLVLFSRINFNTVSATDVSGITYHETGHLTVSSGIASQISGAFQHGFGFAVERSVLLLLYS